MQLENGGVMFAQGGQGGQRADPLVGAGGGGSVQADADDLVVGEVFGHGGRRVGEEFGLQGGGIVGDAGEEGGFRGGERPVEEVGGDGLGEGEGDEGEEEEKGKCPRGEPHGEE